MNLVNYILENIAHADLLTRGSAVLFSIVIIRIILIIVFMKVYKVPFQKAVNASILITTFGKKK